MKTKKTQFKKMITKSLFLFCSIMLMSFTNVSAQIYARLSFVDGYSDLSHPSWYIEHETLSSNIYVEFFSDADCQNPAQIPDDATLTLQDKYIYYHGYGNSYPQSANTYTVTIQAGSSSAFIVNKCTYDRTECFSPHSYECDLYWIDMNACSISGTTVILSYPDNSPIDRY